MSTVNVSIPGELETFVDERVGSGAFGSASDYVNALIRQDQSRQRLLHGGPATAPQITMPLVWYGDRPRTRDQVAALARAYFPEDADIFEQALLPAITFVEAPRADGRIALRLGGHAPLPADREWPANGDRQLVFIGAVDLAVVGPLDVTGALPTAGSLLFFYDIVSQSWGLDPHDSAPWRVLLVSEDEKAGSPERHRQPHPSDSTFMSRPAIDQSEVHDAAPTWTMPMRYEPCVSGTTYGSAHGEAAVARRRDFEALDDCRPKSFQMLGWPYYSQPNSRQKSVEVCSSGRSWEEVTDVDMADWRLLMQFPKWAEYGGTNWGGPGGGMLEYWIRDSDLRAHNFDRVWIQVDAC